MPALGRAGSGREAERVGKRRVYGRSTMGVPVGAPWETGV